MARGWESKSVESQIEDAQLSREQESSAKSRAELELARTREGLELSRRRIVRELEAARSPVRRAPLEHALAYLDEQLRAIGVDPASS